MLKVFEPNDLKSCAEIRSEKVLFNGTFEWKGLVFTKRSLHRLYFQTGCYVHDSPFIPLSSDSDR